MLVNLLCAKKVRKSNMATSREKFVARRLRNRSSLRRKMSDLPRLCVFRSGRHIHAQVIDDSQRKTLASASSMDKNLRDTISKPWDCDAAAIIGKAVAERAKAAGIEAVAFDRGGYRYHGRVRALADAAREAGLKI